MVLAGLLCPWTSSAVDGHALPDLPPIFTSQPSNQTVGAGQNVNFAVVVVVFGGSQNLYYQWQRLPAGGNASEILSDDATFAGARTPILTISSITASMSGDKFPMSRQRRPQ